MAKRHSPENTKLRHQIKSLKEKVRSLEAMLTRKIPVRPAVFSFAMTMEKVMRDNDKEKGDSWMKMDGKELSDLFLSQIDEACQEPDIDSLTPRLIHIANYAMMLYHRSVKKEEE